MENYGYMKNSELNLVEEVRQKYRISDADIGKLIDLMVDIIKAEHRCGEFAQQLQDTYHLSDKHSYQLAKNINTLCFFPHRAVTDAVGADGTHGDHPVHESPIFKALQEHELLPQGRPSYKSPRTSLRNLRKLLAEPLQTKKRRKAS